jgi:hypothetical protein
MNDLLEIFTYGLSQLVAYHLAHGCYKAGIAQAHRLLQLDPWLEEAHRQLMRLLAYSDQRTATLATDEVVAADILIADFSGGKIKTLSVGSRRA